MPRHSSKDATWCWTGWKAQLSSLTRPVTSFAVSHKASERTRMSTLSWQKSSYSEYGSSCIYVSPGPTGGIHLRESDDPDIILSTTPARLRPLISRIKADGLNPVPDRADP
ncbi:DUF397 domain-containing protein [Streptomyces sp. NPDC037389]|uniref:DUF397 domain-containing protein n=1 Tax=Streptomyces sp. NPDC037389 TaxID=3155369 RepID=UPI0033D4913B